MHSCVERKAHFRAAFYLALACLGFSTSKWFNSAEPQRSYYKIYVAILFVAQMMGARAGQKIFDESSKLK